MKTSLSIALCIAAWVTTSSAQMPETPGGPANQPEINKPVDPTPPTFNRPPAGQPLIPDRPIVVPVDSGTKPTLSDRPQVPERPTTPERPVPSADLQNLIKEFQSAREAFLQQQRELGKQLKEASAEDRAAIREQIKQKLAEWRETQRQQIQEIQQAARDIKERVGNVSEVVDEAKNEGRGR